MTDRASLSIEPTSPAVDAESTLFTTLSQRLGRRGWHFREAVGSVVATRPEWPTQLTVRAREESPDSPPLLGLAIELGTMPLHGERFRDIFNSEREELLRGYGTFKVQQLTGEGAWLKAISGNAFLHGMTDGLSRRASLAVLDRATDGGDIVEQFVADSNRMVESGGEIAALLQRIYQRTVLSAPLVDPGLPDLVRPSLAMLPLTSDGEASYPWRR